jgi:hypothetical protein
MPTAERYSRYREDQTTIWVSKTAADFLSRERGSPGEGAAAVLDRVLNEYRKLRRSSGGGAAGGGAGGGAAKSAAKGASKAGATKSAAKSGGAGTRGTRATRGGGAGGGAKSGRRA